MRHWKHSVAHQLDESSWLQGLGESEKEKEQKKKRKSSKAKMKIHKGYQGIERKK